MSTVPSSRQTTFLGHPIGLYFLFFTEMWERFSYYGMRALLMLYMVNHFKWTTSGSASIYKWYTTLVYVTPIIGGLLADRYLGNRLAVIIGAALMAVGHFLMAFEAQSIFFAALVFLVIGNGFFKPNMSTQVGQLYPVGDGRRDGAYTIFYMGINLGAFLSPLACGWLQENTKGGFHSGFALAGIGMVLGLLTYLVGQPFINEVSGKAGREEDNSVEGRPSAIGALSGAAPFVLCLAGIALMAQGAIQGFGGHFKEMAPGLISGASLLLVSWITLTVTGAVRDRVLVIVVIGLFAVFFWAAFEQAGSALNLWADKTTNRYLTEAAPPANPFPPAEQAESTAGGEEGHTAASIFEMFMPKGGTGNGGEASTLNPVPTAWFQSINALAIFILAPFFAWLWLVWRISTPLKMVLGIFLMGCSFFVMAAAAVSENQPTTVNLTALPGTDGIRVDANGAIHVREETGKRLAGEAAPNAGEEIAHAGRLRFAEGSLRATGVLPDIERDRLVAASAPASFRKALAEARVTLGNQHRDKLPVSTTIVIDDSVKKFDLRYTGWNSGKATYDPATRSLSIKSPLADRDVKALLVAAGDADWRAALDTIMVESARFKVSPWWLFFCYILSTLGELCLSPVGLSMTSKLAPAKYATVLMGMWLLVSAFGNYAAGALGEMYSEVPPVPYFGYTGATLAAAALVLLVFTRIVAGMMHGADEEKPVNPETKSS